MFGAPQQTWFFGVITLYLSEESSLIVARLASEKIRVMTKPR